MIHYLGEDVRVELFSSPSHTGSGTSYHMTCKCQVASFLNLGFGGDNSHHRQTWKQQRSSEKKHRAKNSHMFPGNKMFLLYVIKATMLSPFLPRISLHLLVEGLNMQKRNTKLVINFPFEAKWMKLHHGKDSLHHMRSRFIINIKTIAWSIFQKKKKVARVFLRKKKWNYHIKILKMALFVPWLLLPSLKNPEWLCKYIYNIIQTFNQRHKKSTLLESPLSLFMHWRIKVV